MTELIARRAFPAAYIGLDLLFLALFAGILLWKHRSAGFTLEEKLRPLIINSLLETNLGLPYLFAIYIAVTGRFTEQLHHRPEKLTFRDRLREYHHKEENP